MKDKFSLTNLKFVFKIGSVLVYFVLLVGVFVLFMGRKSESIQFDFLMDQFPGFYSHISNFMISFVICLICGFIEVLIRQSLKGTLFVAGLLILANFIYEWFIPIVNTPDKVDAYYGFAGTILPFIYHFLNLKFGLKLNPLYNN